MKNNKLIAEFMGAALYSPNDYDLYSCPSLNDIFADVDSQDENAQHFFKPDEMKFDTSWDWLMPVVEKIENTLNENTSTDVIGHHLYDIEIRQNVTTIHGTNIEYSLNPHYALENLLQLEKAAKYIASLLFEI